MKSYLYEKNLAGAKNASSSSSASSSVQTARLQVLKRAPPPGCEAPDSTKPLPTANDQLLKQWATKRIANHSHFQAHRDAIHVNCQQRRLILTGTLPTFYLKQILQHLLTDLPGVRLIDNRVQVVSSCGLSSEPTNPSTLRKERPR